MSQDNPQAGDVFVCDNEHKPVYLLVKYKDKLSGMWFTFSGAPTMRPAEGHYPDRGHTFLCNINNLLKTIEDKLHDAAFND